MKCFTQSPFSLKSKIFSSDTLWEAAFLSQASQPIHPDNNRKEAVGKEKPKGHLKKSSAELRLNDFSTTTPVFWIV